MEKVQPRIVRSILRAILILLIIPLVLTGCTNTKKYSYGFGSQWEYKSIMLAFESDTHEFPIDDVTFELYYGLYESSSSNPKSSYRSSDRPGWPIVFGVYAGDDSSNTRIMGKNVKSLQIEGLFLLKTIAEEEAFTEEYAYTINRFSTDFNHHESITIPAESFTKETGTIEIWIYAYNESIGEEEKSYCGVKFNTFGIDYEVIDCKTVILHFEYGVHT